MAGIELQFMLSGADQGLCFFGQQSNILKHSRDRQLKAVRHGLLVDPIKGSVVDRFARIAGGNLWVLWLLYRSAVHPGEYSMPTVFVYLTVISLFIHFMFVYLIFLIFLIYLIFISHAHCIFRLKFSLEICLSANF